MSGCDEYEAGDTMDVRPLSPESFETLDLRTLINGGPSAGTSALPPPLPPQPPQPMANTLNLSGFSQFHAPGPLPMPPAKRPCPAPPPLPLQLPPLPPLLAPPVQAQPAIRQRPAHPLNNPHAGLMRPYGGVERWCAMMRGEIPWPTDAEMEDA